MRPSLSRTGDTLFLGIGKLETVVAGLPNIPVNLQYFISEIVLIRAAALLEQAVAEISYKIASGAIYGNGSVPKILYPCRSISAARDAMLIHARRKPQSHLKWTRAKFINESTKHVIDSGDHFQTCVAGFGSQISEIFRIRNFAAHRNRSTRDEFKFVIRTIYNRDMNLQLGQFLLGTNYVVVSNLVRYLIEIKVIISDLIKG